MHVRRSTALSGDRDAAPVRRRSWWSWVSSALFVLVVTCFVLPFASTSCTLPGGYGRGGPGTSTVYRGVDLVFGTVPEVAPANGRVRQGADLDAGRLGVQPLTALALLAAIAGTVLSLTLGRLRAARLAAWAAVTAGLLVAQQAIVVGAIAGRIELYPVQQLPAGKTAHDYVNTGPGFTLALLLLGVILLLNATLAVISRRAEAAGRGARAAGSSARGPDPDGAAS